MYLQYCSAFLLSVVYMRSKEKAVHGHESAHHKLKRGLSSTGTSRPRE